MHGGRPPEMLGLLMTSSEAPRMAEGSEHSKSIRAEAQSGGGLPHSLLHELKVTCERDSANAAR